MKGKGRNMVNFRTSINSPFFINNIFLVQTNDTIEYEREKYDYKIKERKEKMNRAREKGETSMNK